MPTTLLSGIGLSSAAGLNAYFPLITLALADRISSSFNLPGPYDAISSNTGIVLILLVMVLELIGDKIPRVDHFNDILHTPIRPLVGAISFMAVAAESDALNVWVAGLLGLAIAGGVHYWKMTHRPSITVATKGIGNPILSLQEDAAAIALCLASVIWPWANLAVVPFMLWWIHRATGRMISGDSSVMNVLLQKRPVTK